MRKLKRQEKIIEIEGKYYIFSEENLARKFKDKPNNFVCKYWISYTTPYFEYSTITDARGFIIPNYTVATNTTAVNINTYNLFVQNPHNEAEIRLY